jgi:hypothetical protein
MGHALITVHFQMLMEAVQLFAQWDFINHLQVAVHSVINLAFLAAKVPRSVQLVLQTGSFIKVPA